MSTEQEILAAVNAGEAKDWEFKSARGGLPHSMWETYSAMANTDGGVIVLGIEERDGGFFVSGLAHPTRTRTNLWSSVNNRSQVNINLLSDQDVTLDPIGGHTVLTVRVPRASRRQRPVFVGQNPLTGTYRRNSDGDYHCTPEEVGRMLADQSDEPADSRILEGFGLDDLDLASIQQYRQRFSARDPTHPWLALEPVELLDKLGGWRTDRLTGVRGLTVAGLLMFGKDEAIRAPEALPKYHLDYRERLSEDPGIRWTDRLVPDGTWVANLFQFYQRVIVRLTRDLKVPFRLEPDLFRRDDTPVHEAIREAVVNALVHTDYRGDGGVVIDHYRSRIEMSNPGTLLVSYEQLLRGGVSECRNKSLQVMFRMVGGGDQAGSGIDKIRQGWSSQHWRFPAFEETQQPDRVQLILPMESLLPPAAMDELRRRFGRRLEGLDALEMQTLVTAHLEGQVSNRRLQMVSDRHPADLTRMLQRLVSGTFLQKECQKRGSFYLLAAGEPPRSVCNGERSVHNGERSVHRETGSVHEADSSEFLGHGAGLDGRAVAESVEEAEQLRTIAEPARVSPRLTVEEIRAIILKLCSARYLTAGRLSVLMNRSAHGLITRHLRPMVRDGLLTLRYPEQRHHPNQAYTSTSVPPSNALSPSAAD